MARLTVCPDCRSAVSSKAMACPRCGRKLRQELFALVANLFAGCLVVGFAGVCALCGLVYWGGRDVPVPPIAAPPVAPAPVAAGPADGVPDPETGPGSSVATGAPTRASELYRVAKELDETGNVTDAIAAYRRVVTGHPDSPEARMASVRIRALIGR